MKKAVVLPLAACVFAMSLAAIPIAFAIGANGPTASDLEFIGGVMQIVERYYVHPIGTDQLAEDALKGMLMRLDPHSDYVDEKEYRQSSDDMNGKFGGVGIEIAQQGATPKVISAIDDTPAARAHVEPGDLIVSVNGQSTQGIDLHDLVAKIRGEAGTTVTLTISRGGKTPFDVALVRSVIPVESVKSKSEPNGIGYIRISRFDADTPRDFRRAIANLKQAAGGQLRGLVLDLRNDPGGLLTAAVDISGSFLDGGTVVSMRGRDESNNRLFEAPPHGDLFLTIPVAVLINGASASASEIVAGALQDRHRATVIGTTSFGKGSVQTIIPLKGHGAIRLTTALYYTPAGRSVQDNGITPDLVVEAPKDEQIEGAVTLRESELQGALGNPNAPSDPARGNKAASDKRADYSPPIKAELIATPQDSQLKAALDFLGRARRPG